jgi:hypothetical protein
VAGSQDRRLRRRPHQINFLNGSESDEQAAGDNCVANEKGPYPVTAPPGVYRIVATYTPGKHPPWG